VRRTLFVTDLDGTLLGPNGRLSPNSASLLAQAMEGGAFVSFATSRSWRDAMEALGSFLPNAPCVASGGLLVADPAGGPPLRDLRLDRSTAVAVARAFMDSGVMSFVKCVAADGRERILYRELRHPGQRRYASIGDGRFLRVDEYESFILSGGSSVGESWEPALIYTVEEKAAVAVVMDRLAALRRQGCRFEFLSFHDPYTGHEWIEALPEGADKGTAALFVKERVGAARMVAFGDGANDLSLFRAADHAVAVANAVPELKAVAVEVIGPAADDSVAGYILRMTR